MATKAMTKKEKNEMMVLNFEDDMGAGFEEATSESFAIPFLRQLQAMSPQCKKSDAAYIKGAEEGDFINTVTEELYKGEEGVLIVPCHYAHRFNLWAPDRGGFRGSVLPDEYTRINKSKNEDGEEIDNETGNTIQDTREHYIIAINTDGSYVPALLSLSGSQIKKSKKWMTQMQNIRISNQIAPMFSQVYKLSAVNESNDKGSWAGVKVEHVKQVDSLEIYEAAKQFRDLVRSGQAQVQHPDTLTTDKEDDVPY